MKCVVVTNTGKSFYTHEDREKIPDFRIYGDVVILSDNSDADEWIQKVGGTIITKEEALTMLENQFNLAKTDNITRLQQELSAEQDTVFDQTKIEQGSM